VDRWEGLPPPEIGEIIFSTFQCLSGPAPLRTVRRAFYFSPQEIEQPRLTPARRGGPLALQFRLQLPQPLFDERPKMIRRPPISQRIAKPFYLFANSQSVPHRPFLLAKAESYDALANESQEV
jgi:hypothetical protein